MKLTRRKLASLVAPAVLVSRSPRPSAVQTPAPQPSGSALDAARARIKQNGDLLAQQSVPMDTEPAFQFKA